MPVDWSRYPKDWKAIALAVKEAQGWKCAPPSPERPGCGVQCRKPDELFRKGDPRRGHRRTLTVAHLNHEPSDCRPENLIGLCAPCHLRYDRFLHGRNAAETMRRKRDEQLRSAGQQALPI